MNFIEIGQRMLLVDVKEERSGLVTNEQHGYGYIGLYAAQKTGCFSAHEVAAL
jgi:hypothetical protein